MGRSKNACLNILSTCAGTGGGGGDVAADPTNSSTAATDCHCEQSKVLSDKSRWSFRRRSTRHRVLRNNESTEVETVTRAKNADPMNNSSNNFCSPKYSSATDKTVEQEKPKENNIVAREIDEKPGENNLVIKETVEETHDDLNENFVVEEKEEKPEEDMVKDVEVNLEQNNLLAIEDVACIPEKNENLEQAAVVIQSGFRGYRARKETVVLKKVVMIQAATRGFLVRSQAVGTLRCLLAIVKMQAVVRIRQTPKKSDITDITEGNGGSFSLGNKTCTSNDNLLLNGFASKILDTMPKTKATHIKCDPYKPNSTWEWLERWTYTITLPNAPQLPDHKEINESKIGTNESNAEDSHEHTVLSDAPNPSSNFESQYEIEKPQEDMDTAFILEDLNMKFTENGVVACETYEENSIPKLEFKPNSTLSCENLELDDVHDTKFEEGDVQKGGDKKAINPNFAAAQMKFQELSSNTNLSISRSISNSKSFTFPSQADEVSPKNDNNIKNHETNNSTAGGALIKAVSECGTEISISSTLDSPDRSEIEGGEIVLEIGALENSQHSNQTHTYSEIPETQIEAEAKNSDLEFQPEPTKETETITNSVNTATKSIETEKLLQSPEGTPISNTTTTVTDVHGTPTSQSSVNTKTTKRERKKKPRKLSTKRSLNSPISDSIINNNGVIKRHGSIGHGGETEPRISNSSLPSYMQATESARAKLHPSVSPKLSPDVSETNGSGKKRHSLPIAGPGAGGKDSSSPRMQRSQSHQAQADAKGNGTDSNASSDKRWQI